VPTVTTSHTGRRGRPRKEIRRDILEEALSAKRSITVSSLAKAIGIHRNTLYARIQELGLERKFDDLSDFDLDLLVKRYKKIKPNSGLRYIVGFLRYHGLRIQRIRVKRSIQRVDAVGQVLRHRQTITRKEYKVPRPNSLWHLDGHHKLVWWGIVIHGMIDGYDRTASILLIFPRKNV
jgi:ribosomal protein S24E